jgi:hypothetical protein
MPLQSPQQIEEGILELCSEDDWGSWELWWNTSADTPKDEMPELKLRFLNVVTDLVAAGKLIPKREAPNGELIVAQYDRHKLLRELDSADDPQPDFFWFGTE